MKPDCLLLKRLKTLCYVVSMESRKTLCIERLADVLRQVASSHPALLTRSRSNWEVANLLDVDETVRPGTLDD